MNRGQSSCNAKPARGAIDQKRDDAGATTSEGGSFLIEIDQSSVVVEISFIGFKPKELTEINYKDQIAELGLINLEPEAKSLDDVVVRAEKSTTD